MISRKRPAAAEASPDTRRLTCCEDIGDLGIVEGRRTASARKPLPPAQQQQPFETALLKQLLGSLPPYRREQVMKDLECLSTTPKKKLWQLFSPTHSQPPNTAASDSHNSWLLPAGDEPASVSKPSPRQLARGSYIMQCSTQAKPLLARELCAQRSPRGPALGSPRGCRQWPGKQAMRKLNPGVSVIGGSTKLHISVCH